MKTKTTKTFLSLLALALVGVHQARGAANTFALATEIITSNNTPGVPNLMLCSVEPGEPGHASNGGNGAQKSAWWRWTAPSNGFCTVDTIVHEDDQFVLDTLVAVYTGSTVSTLTRVAHNDDMKLLPGNAGSRASSATFYAIQGTTYHIAVDAYHANDVNANNSKVRLRLRHLAAVAESRIGAFYNSDEPGVHGTVHLSKTAGHSFTAKMMLAGKAVSFSGVFSLDGYFVTSFERKVPAGAVPLPPLTLWLDGAQNGTFGIVSSISSYVNYPFHTVQRFTMTKPNTMKGLYTAVFNSGTVSLTTSTTGAVTGAAVLPDGTKATIGSSLCMDSPTRCWAPFTTSLHLGTGYFGSYLRFTEAGVVDTVLGLYSNYLRPAKPGAVFYPAGLNLASSILGSTYIPPLAGTRALGFLDASMGAGKLSIPMQAPEITPAITENLTLGATNLFKFATPLLHKPVLTLNKTNGLVTGSILDQAGKKRTFTGILYRDGMTAKLAGHLTGITFNPAFSVIP
jgi:hypothetical protein